MTKDKPPGLSTLAVSAGGPGPRPGSAAHGESLAPDSAGRPARVQGGLGPAGERPHVAPIYQTSIYEYADASAADAAAEGGAYIYSRYANPTVEALEAAVASLEGGDEACAFASGMGALAATLLALGRGAHVLVSDGIYGGTTELATGLGPSLGLAVESVPAWDLDAVEAHLRTETRVLLVETISNPLLRVVDLPALAALCHRNGTALVVDSTFASPALVRPLAHGATAVVHSASKYLSGHGDVIGGVVVAARPVLEGIRLRRKLLGANLAPFEAFLTLRGLRTLGLRLPRQCDNAAAVARHLQGHEKVRAVHYPGLSHHPDHERASRLLARPGAMVSFEVANVAEARRFYDRIRVFHRAASLGDVASLVTHPVSFSHRGVPADARRAAGITEGLLRLSVGIEDEADLLDDLDQALA